MLRHRGPRTRSGADELDAPELLEELDDDPEPLDPPEPDEELELDEDDEPPTLTVPGWKPAPLVSVIVVEETVPLGPPTVVGGVSAARRVIAPRVIRTVQP